MTATGSASPPEHPTADDGRHGRSLVSGLAWTAGAKWTVQVVSWASTLVVARLLTPADYGIIGMALVYLGLVQLVSELGLGTALIQHRAPDTEQIAYVNGVSLILGLLMYGVSAAVAYPLALFFHEPAVQPVVLVLATTYVITALQVVPSALLTRELRFRRLALIESTEALFQTAVTLALALAGARYWAIILGSVAAKVLSTALLVASRPHRMAWPRTLAPVRQLLTFGWQVVVTRVTYYLYSNADFAVIGRLLGKVVLGAYTFGWTIASIPADKINAVLGRVVIPVFASMRDDLGALTRYVLRLSEALTYTVLPASVGLALVAPDFVRVALGERWMAAVVPLRLLSVHVTVRCISSLFAQTLLALGDSKRPMTVGLWHLGIMPVLFVVGAKTWGAPGVALMWLVGQPAITAPLLILYTARRLKMPLSRLVDALWPPVMGTLAMAAGVAATRVLVPEATAAWIRLSAAIGVGVALYPATMWMMYRERVRGLRAALARLRH